VLHAPIARGGMARVYTARLVGAEGFNRLVAAKRLHPQFTDDPDFVTMFHDEARVASRIHHPNVVPVLDVVVESNEVILVQEYVHGVPLDRLMRGWHARGEGPMPLGIAVAIIGGVLAGLHAAHETKDELERPLDIVHRDVSPQNIMVSVDGIPRLLDFGIARAQSNAHVTREGLFKGKVAYMAPEQLKAEGVTRQADLYAAGVVFWELLTNRRMHGGRSDAEIFAAVLHGAIPLVTDALDDLRARLGATRWTKLVEIAPVVTQAISLEPTDRFNTAADMLDAILAVCPAATPMEVAHWVKEIGAEFLDERQRVIATTEESWRSMSKMVAASAIAGAHPDSAIVKRATASPIPSPLAPALGSSWPVPPAAIEARDAAVDARRSRLPWMMAGALLLLSGVLVGVLSARAPSPSPAEAAAARPIEITVGAQPPAVADPPAAQPSPEPAPSAPKPLAQSQPAAPSPAPPPAHWQKPAPPKPTPPVAHAPAPATTSAPTPAPEPPPAPAAKPDCNPPFYFEGTKKLYKAGCL
jgi:serine/threonine-protein kinase